MKIQTVDGKNIDTETETNDVMSAVLEETHKYMKFMSQYKVPFYLRFSVGDRYSGAFNFDDGKNKTGTETFMVLTQDIIRSIEEKIPGYRFVCMSDEAFEAFKEKVE